LRSATASELIKLDQTINPDPLIDQSVTENSSDHTAQDDDLRSAVLL